jgi:PAS domain S-box-containing protein
MKPDKDRKDKRGNTTCAEGNKESANLMQKAEELYKTLAENSLAAVFIVQDGKFQFINTSAITNVGYNADELIGQYSDMIVHPEDREMVKRRGREMLRGGDATPYEYRIVTKQGHIRWIMQIVSSIQFNGKTAILGNSIDITEHFMKGKHCTGFWRRNHSPAFMWSREASFVSLILMPRPTLVIQGKNY